MLQRARYLSPLAKGMLSGALTVCFLRPSLQRLSDQHIPRAFVSRAGKVRTMVLLRDERTHKMQRGPNWGLDVERGREAWEGDQVDTNSTRILQSFAFQPWLSVPPRLLFAASRWPALVAGSLTARLLPSGPAPPFHVAHCAASGTDIKLLSEEMTCPGRRRYSYSGINRDISLIGQVPRGAFLVPGRLSARYKSVEPCFYFPHRLKATPFFFLIYRPCCAQSKCSINIC